MRVTYSLAVQHSFHGIDAWHRGEVAMASAFGKFQRAQIGFASVFLVLCTFLCATSATPADLALAIRKGGPLFSLGVGVNSVLGESKDDCIKDSTSRFEAKQLSQDLDIELLRSVTDMSTAIGATAYATYIGAMSSVSTNLRAYESRAEQTAVEHFYIRLSARGAVTKLVKAAPSDEVLDAFKIDPGGSLVAATCGDAFVNEIESGGEFLAIVTHDIMDVVTKKTILCGYQSSGGQRRSRRGNCQETRNHCK